MVKRDTGDQWDASAVEPAPSPVLDWPGTSRGWF